DGDDDESADKRKVKEEKTSSVALNELPRRASRDDNRPAGPREVPPAAEPAAAAGRSLRDSRSAGTSAGSDGGAGAASGGDPGAPRLAASDSRATLGQLADAPRSVVPAPAAPPPPPPAPSLRARLRRTDAIATDRDGDGIPDAYDDQNENDDGMAENRR